MVVEIRGSILTGGGGAKSGGAGERRGGASPLSPRPGRVEAVLGRSAGAGTGHTVFMEFPGVQDGV